MPATPMQGATPRGKAAGAPPQPLRGIALEDGAAQARELAAFWSRQSQLLNNMLQQEESNNEARIGDRDSLGKTAKATGKKPAVLQGRQSNAAHESKILRKVERQPETPAKAEAGQRPQSEIEGEKVACKSEQGQGASSSHEVGVCPIKAKEDQTQEGKGAGDEPEDIIKQ